MTILEDFISYNWDENLRWVNNNPPTNIMDIKRQLDSVIVNSDNRQPGVILVNVNTQSLAVFAKEISTYAFLFHRIYDKI